MWSNPTDRPLRVLTLFSGVGGSALGFKQAGYESVGAFDLESLACQAFEYLTGQKATQADLFTMTPADLRAACTGRPDVVFTSPPCKPHSRCLPEAKSQEPEYVAMAAVALHSVWLVLEAWGAPPPFILLENVPGMLSRGKDWMRHIKALLRSYGYAVNDEPHDCGELGGLAQRRKRVLLAARHMEQVKTHLRLPPRHRLRGVGEVLGQLPVPLPGSDAGGRMHRLPRMSAMNWVRLALIPAGGDWRDLPESVAIVPGEHRHRGGYGVTGWEEPGKTVVGAAEPRNKPASVADPRLGERSARQNGGFGVNEWEEPGHTVMAEGTVRNTWASVEDPRLSCDPRAGAYGVAAGDEPAATILAAAQHDNGAFSVADPRIEHQRREGALGVTGWGQPSTTVIANGIPQNGPWQAADPRVKATRAGTYHVQGWAEPSHTVIARAGSKTYAGTFGIADPRIPVIEGPSIDLGSKRPCYLIIQAADGTWHRPMTTLELAALQDLPTQVNGEWLNLPGNHEEMRELIGNAVPPGTAKAIAEAVAVALRANGRFVLSNDDIWVAPAVESLQAVEHGQAA